MSTAALREATAGVPAEKKPKDFPAMLQVWLPEIKRALPKHLNADRMSRIALTAFRRTPKLGECDPRSVFAAVIQASQLGLEPDTLGRSYLIPYNQKRKGPQGWTTTVECQFVPGWKGLMDLMNRSGLGSAWTGAVFSGDFFEYQLGDQPFVKHIPAGEDGVEKMTHVYAVGRAKGSEWPVIEVWPVAKVRRHRDRYNKVGDKHYSHDNWEMYARKVVLLQVLKYLPCSAELATAITLNDDAEIGRQKIDLKDAIEGTYEPVAGAGDDDQNPVTMEQIGQQIAASTTIEAVDLALASSEALPEEEQKALTEEALAAKARINKDKATKK